MLEVHTTDYHTAGEPFRIVTAGAPDIPGATVRDRREHARASAEVDRVRRLLCNEPRGHADMYGCFPVAPDDGGARLGVLFWHKDGFSTACGHGTIALGAWAVESGLVAAAADGETDVPIDVPSGRVVARVRCAGGAVRDVTFRNVPSYVLARDVPVATPFGAAAGRRRLRRRDLRERSGGGGRPRRRPGGLRGPDRARPGGQGRARGHRARPPSERRPRSPASTGRSCSTTSATPRPGRTSAT